MIVALSLRIACGQITVGLPDPNNIQVDLNTVRRYGDDAFIDNGLSIYFNLFVSSLIKKGIGKVIEMDCGVI